MQVAQENSLSFLSISGQRIVDLPIKHATYYTNDAGDHSQEDFLYIGKTEGVNERVRSLIQFDLAHVPLDSVNNLCIQVCQLFIARVIFCC